MKSTTTDASTMVGASLPGESSGHEMTEQRTRPRGWQYVKYAYGAKLPASMIDWVRNDLAGPGAAVRMVVRWSIPCILVLIPMLFVPADWIIRLNMTVPILLPYLFFAMALNRVYRRYRLTQHGLDPELVNKLERERNADLYEEYERKYRGRRS